MRAMHARGHSVNGAEVNSRKCTRPSPQGDQSYRMLFSSNPLPMWVYDTETLRFLDVNDTACQRYGYTRAEFLAMTLLDIRPAEDAPLVWAAVGALKRDEIEKHRWRHRCKDGTFLDVEAHSHAVEFAGRPARFVCVFDISDRIEAEKGLRDADSRFRALVEQSITGIYIFDEGNVVYTNAKLSEISGYSAEEFAAMRITDLIVEEDRHFAVEARRRRNEGERGSIVFDCRVTHKRGHIIYISVETKILTLSGRDVTVGVVRDISARMEALEALRESELRLRHVADSLERRVAERTADLEAANRELEAFDYSISHDLRAPLRQVSGFMRVLLSDHAGSLNEAGQDLLVRSWKAGQKMERMVNDLLSLAILTRGETRLGEVDLSSLATTVLEDLARVNPARDVEIHVTPGIHVEVDQGLVHILLENLLGNAWKFTSQKEGARIEVGCMRTDGKLIVYVRDNGAGFDMHYADKLFTPFRRLHSNEQFKGSGIGLATVQRIVKRHGGQIWAEGRVDQGATFYFTLSP